MLGRLLFAFCVLMLVFAMFVGFAIFCPLAHGQEKQVTEKQSQEKAKDIERVAELYKGTGGLKAKTEQEREDWYHEKQDTLNEWVGTMKAGRRQDVVSVGRIQRVQDQGFSTTVHGFLFLCNPNENKERVTYRILAADPYIDDFLYHATSVPFREPETRLTGHLVYSRGQEYLLVTKITGPVKLAK